MSKEIIVFFSGLFCRFVVSPSKQKVANAFNISHKKSISGPNVKEPQSKSFKGKSEVSSTKTLGVEVLNEKRELILNRLKSNDNEEKEAQNNLLRRLKQFQSFKKVKGDRSRQQTKSTSKSFAEPSDVEGEEVDDPQAIHSHEQK